MKFVKHFLLATLSGLLFTAAWPANGFPFLILAAFVPLFFIENELTSNGSAKGTLKTFAYAYWAFLIWNIATTYWVCNSTTEGGIFAFVMNSLFMAIVFLFFMGTKRKLDSKRGYFSLIVYWISFEYMHLNWDLSWPWLTLGNVFAAYPETVQWYEYTGVLGGSFWILAVNIFLFNALLFVIKHETSFIDKLKAFAPSFLLIAIPIIISLKIYSDYSENGQAAEVILVQPNVDPWNEKFSSINYEVRMVDMVNSGLVKADQKTDYLIFPETAFPFGIWAHERDSCFEILLMKAAVHKFPRLKLISGITYLEIFDQSKGDTIPISASLYDQNDPNIYYDDHNSAMQIDSSGRIQLYHKSKLVPGPEMVPFAKYMKPIQERWFSEMGNQMGNYGTQKERSVFTSKTDSACVVGVAVCYESIYGEFVTEYVQKGARFLSVITNDGWWQNTAGHRQHFEYSRLRAIETRRDVARAANTGISGFINQRGDVIQKSTYWEPAVLKGTVYLNNSMTFYVINGDYMGRLSLFTAFFLLLYANVRSFLNKRKL